MNVVIFMLGIMFGGIAVVCALAMCGANGDENKKYVRHWKDGKVYEVIEEEAVDAENLQHMVIYKAKYGQGTIYVRTKSSFLGKVKNFQGDEVNRFVRI